ncbi:PREDICTED: uncharacterized protein LOC104763290 [Camelina sativa]|uniref:Uncharacterized protein LOC104763290 n=1 Tax=Camelina sativa TaxID=90675 RepID=A0ABM0XF13_CAMSA|nr:PREDICTED: uncharacterized protein LOC104763290 [Camelina sativa]
MAMQVHMDPAILSPTYINLTFEDGGAERENDGDVDREVEATVTAVNPRKRKQNKATVENPRKREKKKSPVKDVGTDERENNGDDGDVEANEEVQSEEDILERFEYEVEEVVEHWIDEYQIHQNQIPNSSDEDEDPIITRERKIRLGTHDKLAIGRTFFTAFEIKETMLQYALKNRENLKQNRWEKNKISFNCAVKKKCDWRVYLAFDASRQLWVLRTRCTDHTCSSNGKCKLLKSAVIGRLYMDKLRLQPNFMPLDIQRHIKEQWKVVSTIGQVQRGRLLGLQWLKDEYDQQFAHLRGYVAELKESNQYSTAFVDTISNAAGEDVFDRIYVCLGAMKNAFYYCRPIIGIAGTFLKHAVKGCLLTAIGHDANNQIYPVAWATVQSENTDNWLWFLNQLKADLNLKDGSDYVVLSDRCKGIISAVKSVLPNAEHRPCVKHIVENLKKKHANKDYLKKHVWNLAWSYSEAEYKINLNAMRAYSLSLYEDVMKEETKTWCRPYFKIGSCCEDVDNNATESFNATIVKAKAKALVPMMETIRRQAMAHILAKEEEDALRCEVTKGTHGTFEVWVDGNSNPLNLTSEKWECSCCKWQVTGILCMHAYAAIIDVGKDVEDFVSPYFTTDIWLQQYEIGPYPVRGQRFWMTNNYVLLKAPPEPILPGRKKGSKKKYDRIKGKLESPKKKKGKNGKEEPKILKLSRKGRIMHCRSCGEAEHNAAGCKNFPKEKKSKKSKDEAGESTIEGPETVTQTSQPPDTLTQKSQPETLTLTQGSM